MANLPPFVRNFWRNVDVGAPDDCWPWMHSRKASGYGTYKRGGITTHAHRIAYEMEHGSIPKGMVVRHLCHSKPCCNPRHLTIGTQDENMQDSATRLTRAVVEECRRLHAMGWSYNRLATSYGISRYTIRDAVTGRTWRG